MRRFSSLAVCALVLTGAVWAAQLATAKRSTYTNDLYGFSFDAPSFPKAAANQPVVPVILSGPSVGGFASNINVNIQPIATTRQGYRDLSLGQMKQLGLKVNEDRDVTISGHEAIRFDYEGLIQNRNLRFLSLAVIEKERVILVTCTALGDGFKSIEPEFKACLDSFKLRGTGPGQVQTK